MIFINSIATIICILVNILIFRNINIWLNINFRFQLFAVILVWFTSITNINMILWRCEERPIAFGTYQISQSALNAITTIIFVISMLLGWEGRVYSMMCAAIIFGTISLFILHKRGYIDFKLQKKYIIQTVLFALPIIPHALSFWFRGGVEKILLSNMCGLSENGLYSVALTWGAVVTMFFTAFNNAYAPFLYKKLAFFDKDKSGTLEQQKKLVRLIKICLWGTGAFVIVSYFVSIIMIKAIYPQDYWRSISYLPWVMLAQLFQGCYLMFVCFTHYTFKTKQLGIITFSWSLIACALAWLGIKFWGAVGVSIASAFVSFAIFVSVAILAMKVYSLPWRQLLTLKL